MIALTLTKERIKLKNQEVEKVSMRANTYSLNGHLILLPLVKVLKDYVRATPANWRAIQLYDVNHTLKLIACMLTYGNRCFTKLPQTNQQGVKVKR